MIQHFAEALEQLKRDPELARWYQQENELHNAIARKLDSALQPPAHVKEVLLASTRVAEPKVRKWRARLLAAAACLAVIGISFFFAMNYRSQQRHEVASFNDVAESFLKSSEDTWLAHKATSFDEVQKWIAANGGIADLALPPMLQNQGTMGCKVFEWNSTMITFICFNMDNRHAHLFVVSREHLRDAPAEGTRRIGQMGEFSTALWTQGKNTYLLATHLSPGELERLI